jgi:replication initiation protein RepC
LRLAARDQTDQFQGLPHGMAKPFRFLAAFQEAEPYLGLPPQAFKLIACLVKMTQSQDWETGSRPIAWPSVERQAEFVALSPARMKALNRLLYEAGIFVPRDSPTGKRHGRRDDQGRILEAYGFDLSPPAYRYDEFVRVAAAAKAERDRITGLGSAPHALAGPLPRLAGLAEVGPLLPDWSRLAADTAAALVAAIRRAAGSDDLA